MKAAVITRHDAPPLYGDFAEPEAADGEAIVHVAAAALTALSRARASGRHYSASETLPAIAGQDGVGRLDDGRRVYFMAARALWGTMAERSLARSGAVVELPPSLDDVTAAAIANPGMSSMAALHRAGFQRGESVLVLGASGASGKLAVSIARHLGARRVISVGRREWAGHGAPPDVHITLDQPRAELAAALQAVAADGIDVVLDYLWGAPAEHLLTALFGKGAPNLGARVRFVQIGSIAGPTVPLHGDLLRGSGLEMLGSGLGSVAPRDLLAAIGRVFQAAGEGVLAIDTEAAPLADVTEAWERNTGTRRIVFRI